MSDYWQSGLTLLYYKCYFRAEDRIRHYMIDKVKNVSLYLIVGEDLKFVSLTDMVNFYKTVSVWQYGFT